MKAWFKKRKRLKISLIVVLVLLVGGGIVANRYVKQKGFRNLWDYISKAGSNYNKSRSARYETLEIKIADSDFKKLEKIREKALERGILISEDGNWVDAKVKWNKKKSDVKLRLKGHMTDHLGEDKWSFRIKTKGNDAIMGMKIFSLQEPGTRNYIYEWIYHQMMEQEGIIALNYDFVKLKVNGEDWGIYALEEHFGQELVQHNHRVKGPIVRFDPEMYWKYRINELNGVNIHETSAEFRSAFVDAYDHAGVFEDSALIYRYFKCASLIQALRTGKAVTSQVFDVDKLARFHALIDLVGGHHSLDWSDVKYYYNAESGLLEPVAYESFSINPTAQLAGAFKFGKNNSNSENWESILFSDEIFFEKYVHYLGVYTDKKWLSAFFDRHREALDNKLAILYKEYYSKQLPIDQYEANQKNIKALLSSPKGFVAYLHSICNDSLCLDIGGIDALPYRISAIRVGDSVFKVSPVMIEPRQLNGQLNFTLFRFHLSAAALAKIRPDSKIDVIAAIPGTQKEIPHRVIMTPSPDVKLSDAPADFRQMPFLHVTDSIIAFEKGTHQVNKTISIPKGYRVKIPAGTRLFFSAQTQFISYSPVIMAGNEEEPVIMESGDSLSGSIVLIGNDRQWSEFSHVCFFNGGKSADADISASLRIYHSKFKITDCYFGRNCNDALRISSSSGQISRTVFVKSHRYAINAQYASVELNAVNIKGGVSAIFLKGSRCVAGDIQLSQADCALKVTEMSYFQASNIALTGNKTGLDCSEKSTANLQRLTATKNGLVFKVHKSGNVYGPAVVNVRGMKEKDNAKLSEVGKKSTLNFVKTEK